MLRRYSIKDEIIESPLWEKFYPVVIFVGPPLALIFAVYYVYTGLYLLAAGIAFYIFVALIAFYSVYTKKKLFRFVGNFYVFSMYVADILGLWVKGSVPEQIVWYTVFPILYFIIVGFRAGLFWAFLYYVTFAIVCMVKGIHFTPAVFTNAFAASIVLVILLSAHTHLVEKRTIKLNRSIKIIDNEMTLARKLQRNIFTDGTYQFPDIHVFVKYIPYMDIGGDIYDIFESKKGVVRLFIADIAGHGVRASLMAMSLKTMYDNVRRFNRPPGEILSQLNTHFYEALSIDGAFATCFLVDIDTNLKKIEFSSAGHVAQYLIKDHSLHLLKTKSFPVGIEAGTQYPTATHSVNSGDRLLLFTDGLIENDSDASMNEELEFLEARILEKLTEDNDSLVTELVRTIIEGRMKGNPSDDITFIAAHIS